MTISSLLGILILSLLGPKRPQEFFLRLTHQHFSGVGGHCPVLSERGSGGGVAPDVRVWWAGCHARMKVDIKSFLTEVKKSKLVKLFQRYSHFKISQFHLFSSSQYTHSQQPSHLSKPAQPPDTHFSDNTD